MIGKIKNTIISVFGGILFNIALTLIQILLITKQSSGNNEIVEFLTLSSNFEKIIFIIITVLISPIIEEIIFRGYIWRIFKTRITKNKKLIVLLISLIFALLHGFQDAPFIFTFSLFLGYLRQKHNHIWFGIVSHISFNLTGLIIFMFF